MPYFECGRCSRMCAFTLRNFGGRARIVHDRTKGHFTHEHASPLHFKHSIGGKGGANPRSLHTTLEGPTEYVNARWM
jgi:hypothetical protein